MDSNSKSKTHESCLAESAKSCRERTGDVESRRMRGSSRTRASVSASSTFVLVSARDLYFDNANEEAIELSE